MKISLLLLFTLLFGHLYSQNISDSMLLYYNLDGNAIDASGNGYDGTVNATPTTDRFGNPNGAMYFNGIDNFIDFPNSGALKPQLPLSFSFWIKYDSDNLEERVVFNTSLEEDNNTGVYLTSQSTTGKYAVGYGDGSPFYSSASTRSYISNSIIDTSQWNHVAIVVNGPTDMEIYVNCEESGGIYGGTGGTLAYSSEAGSIGRHDQNTTVPAYLFKGKIDDFGYWNRALTPTEVSALCNDQYLTTQELSIEEARQLVAYPNPFNETITLEKNTDVSISKVQISDATGKIFWEGSYETTIDVSNLASGVYLLTALESIWQIATDCFAHNTWSCKSNQCSWFCYIDITKHSK